MYEFLVPSSETFQPNRSNYAFANVVNVKSDITQAALQLTVKQFNEAAKEVISVELKPQQK
jgi:hypothetical protein